jgi:cell division protein FtsI (penicillin-binding protein 3)
MLALVGICVMLQMVRIVLQEKRSGQGLDEKLSVKVMPIQANRGNILAHDGRLLATSIYKYRLYNDFGARGMSDKSFNDNVDSLALGLAHILREKSAQEYAKDLKLARAKGLRYRPLVDKDVDYVTLSALKKLPILRNSPNKGGLIIEEKIKRIHPQENLASYTVGWVNQVNQGVGIEYSYNNELGGKPGKEIMQRAGGRNTWIPVSSTPAVEPLDGCDVVSTLDIDLQEMTETIIINKLLKSPDLEWGTAVVMDVPTGEIRAIANKKKIRETSAIVEDENYALRYRKDPGSTFKLASFMVMIEKELRLDDTVNTLNGSIIRYGKKFEDEGKTGGLLKVKQAFERSSNVGTIMLSESIYKNRNNHKDFAQRIEALKLKDLVNFDVLPQQNITPLIKSADQYSGLTLSMMSIGYELEITPLQTLALYNAVANNGVMVHPKFIKELNRQGRTIKNFPIQIVNPSVCSKETLDKLHEMLVSVVENGTAKTARCQEFKVAGKTGTAHIAEGRKGYTNQKLSSFAGYFPADHPKYSCIVAFKTFETTNKSYGGAVAAPVFKAIAEKVYARSTSWQRPVVKVDSSVDIPYTKSGSYLALKNALQLLNVKVEDKNNAAEWVTTETKKTIVEINRRGVTKNVVPNVVNMALKDAIYLLENAGLKVKFTGKGTIKSQLPAAGALYNSGETVMLALSYNE